LLAFAGVRWRYHAPRVSASEGCAKNFFVDNHTFTLGGRFFGASRARGLEAAAVKIKTSAA
jgi:hypothetical protein